MVKWLNFGLFCADSPPLMLPPPRTARPPLAVGCPHNCDVDNDDSRLLVTDLGDSVIGMRME